MKISILLPYKENYSPDYAGAVSLFVNDTNKYSKFHKAIQVYGTTRYSKHLSKNYTNLIFKKNFLLSRNKLYVEAFLNYEKKINSDIIEIHNRPSYVNLIRKKFTNKLIFFFHNDPLAMNGSKSIQNRLELLKNTDKIFFNSEWCRQRFFIDFIDKTKYLKKTSLCYQSSSKVKIDFNKKAKIISFVGKLNKAKGYDLFGNAVIKILDEHPDWKAHVYGDEPRENISFGHPNLKIFGFKNNLFILNQLKKISISIICSRWDEPFGRTSLEAASRGAAVITSNNGGLPETTKHSIILKELNINNLYNELDILIKDKKRLLRLQKANYQNFKYTHSYISKIIDNVRSYFYKKSSINFFNIKKRNVLKVMHLTNFNRRFDGRLQYNTGRRINNGFVRLGHNVLTISDRDIIHENKKLSDITGKKELQKNIIDNFKNFKPDCLVLGHADSISSHTLNILKNENKYLKICQWFLDPVGKQCPDYLKNNKRIANNIDLIDYTFLTSCPSVLKKKIDNSFFIPNPSDISFEILQNYKNNKENDVFFAMSHGVHRGVLKKGKFDDREIFFNKLIKKNPKVIFDIYGMNQIQPIWGDNFINAISNSNMAINLSRGGPVKYYSSDRLAQLLGNGLLTFVHEKTKLNDFLSKDEIIFYSNIEDLSYKLNKYKKDRREAVRIAKNGRNKYLTRFNSTIIADYILSKVFEYKSKNDFLWEK
jgi:glycosyltransferase involved in cell wall biosynthesis